MATKKKTSKKPSKQINECDDKIEIIAMEQSYPGSWGRGKSPNEAVNKAVSQGAKRIHGFTIFAVSPGTSIDGIGNFVYTSTETLEHPLKIGTI